MNNTIPQWQQLVYALAKSKGWYNDVDLKAHRGMASYAIRQSLQLALDTEAIRQGKGYGEVCEPTYVETLTPEQHIQIARLWLIASEVFEAIEAVVSNPQDGTPVYYTSDDGKPEGLGIELADVAIRLLDFCEAYQIPLDRYMAIKHTYNESRPQRHGGKKV